MNQNIIKLVLLINVNLYGFEINTHQAITRCAINKNINQCKTNGVENSLVPNVLVGNAYRSNK